MTGSERSEWEQPDPNIEPDPDEIVIPKVPYEEDDSADSDNGEEEAKD